MELAARRYAQKVLLIHLGLLLLAILVVVGAVKYMYRSARGQARSQAQHTQELLTRQTALGIETYYESITNVLNLLQPAESELPQQPIHRPAPGGRISPEQRDLRRRALEAGPLTRVLSTISASIWKNIDDKASMLFVVDPAEHMDVIKVIGSTDTSLSAADVAKQATDWLSSVQKKSISPFMQIGAGGAHLVCVPMRGPERLLMIAVVPVRSLENSLLQQINRSPDTGTTLIDEANLIVSSSRAGTVGHTLTELKDPRTRALAARYGQTKAAGTEVFERPDTLGGVQLDPAMITVQPVEILGTTWLLAVASSLSRVDDMVKPIFKDAMLWAGFVVLAMTTILLSTAMQMIRTRVRFQRMQMEILNRELSQARKIQLSWLPKKPIATHVIDLAAVNRPASHVSGDFYNWFDLGNGRIVVTIGDVTGHGMAAAFLMATTQLLVRTTMQRLGDPGQCLTEVNRQLCTQIFSGQFVTMLLCVIDTTQQTIEIATAGHPPPIIGNGQSHEPLLLEPELVLGVEPDAEYPTQRFPLSEGYTILLYTDGVTEAQASSGERFCVEGLAESLRGEMHSAQSLADAVTTAVDHFRAGRELDDDLTLVAIQLQPSALTSQNFAAAVAQ
jgi:serine phosphatase RsbU (regulator of sigma subunit)